MPYERDKYPQRPRSRTPRPAITTYGSRSRRSALYEENYRRKIRKRRIFAAVVALILVIALGFGGFAIFKAVTGNSKKSKVETPVAATQKAEATPVPEPSVPATLTVNAAGDMIFDRKVKDLISSAGGGAPLANVDDILKDADITVGNLESPLSNEGTQDPDKDVTFRGSPKGIKSLTESGFDFLSLANNHMLDYGPKALKDTLKILDDAKIGHAGAGMDKAQAWEPAVVEREGAKVAFLSFSDILPPGFVAGDNKPGIAPGRTDMDAVVGAIKAAKEANDYVLVSFHWGVEYQDMYNADQKSEAHAAIDAGADMVLSHHPHVIQGVELYNGKLIAYSLGDFVFDHYSRKTGEAFILKASLGPSGSADISAIPVYLNTYGAPKVVEGSEAKVILKRLKNISPADTVVTIEGNIATIAPKED